MQKIDKSNVLSLKYKEWVESIVGSHPKYSSSHEYIRDIKMNLLVCQNGLCAYTEEQLCDLELLKSENWEDGKYIKDLDSQNLVNGDLEHFDCSLKKTQAYLWDNLFMVNSNINCRVKGSKPINPILKPDNSNYDPFKYLEYDEKVNVFFPHNELLDDEKKDVDEMIQILGLNSNKFKREKQIKTLIEDIELGLEIKKPYEYITSWKMTLSKLKEREE